MFSELTDKCVTLDLEWIEDEILCENVLTNWVNQKKESISASVEYAD